MPASYRIQSEIKPGQKRDTQGEQVLRQIEDDLNELYAKIVAGAQAVKRTAVDYYAFSADWWVLVDASAANRTIYLPLSHSSLHSIGVKKVDASANTVTVIGSSGDTVDGVATKVIAAQYEDYTFVPDGITSWFIF
jgi:hypothetical protein